MIPTEAFLHKMMTAPAWDKDLFMIDNKVFFDGNLKLDFKNHRMIFCTKSGEEFFIQHDMGINNFIGTEEVVIQGVALELKLDIS